MFVYLTNYISWSDLTDSECENHRNHVILTKKLKNCTWTANKVPPSSRTKIDKNMEITNFPTVGPKRSEHFPGPSEGLKIWRQTRKEGLLKEKYFAPTYVLTYLVGPSGSDGSIVWLRSLAHISLVCRASTRRSAEWRCPREPSVRRGARL